MTALHITFFTCLFWYKYVNLAAENEITNAEREGGGGGENHFYFRYEQFSVHTCIIFEHHCMCVFLTFILTFKLITHLQRYFYGRMSFCMPVFKDFPYKFPYEILFANCGPTLPTMWPWFEQTLMTLRCLHWISLIKTLSLSYQSN